MDFLTRGGGWLIFTSPLYESIASRLVVRFGVDHADYDGTDLILEALLLSDRVGWDGVELGI